MSPALGRWREEGGSGAQSHFQRSTKFEASRTLSLSQPGLHEALSNKKGKKISNIFYRLLLCFNRKGIFLQKGTKKPSRMLLADLAMNKHSNISTHTAGACMHKKRVSTPKWIKNVSLLQLVYEALGIIITFCFFFEISFYCVAPHGLELTAILLSLSLSAGLICMHHHSWQKQVKISVGCGGIRLPS